uniref:EF1_GNE domain-containing protein n=1 Tax=Heterorhabditis bacteriophora TaxID=37862 RepID=A0A1I7XTQ3_HETBA
MIEVKTSAGLAAFNGTLETQAFATGFALSGEDNKIFEAIGSAPDAKAFPNVARWYKHISSYDKSERASWPSAGASDEDDAVRIRKLQIICVIEDLKVSVDDLNEKITSDFEEYVQSVDIVAFNKI